MVDYLAFFDDQHGNSTMGPPHARILGGPPLRFWHGATRGLNPALPSCSSPAKYHAVSVDGRNQIVSRCMVAVVAHTDIDCALRIVVNCCV